MNVLPHPSLEGSMARTTLRLVVVGLLAIALLPPLLWAGVGALIERERLQARAVSTAWLLDAQGVAGRIDAAVLSGLLMQPPFDAARGQRSIVDASGAPIVSVGAAAWPELTTTLPLRRPTSRMAAVQMRHSLQPLVIVTAVVAFASVALALALWLGALARPVRALGQSERRLRSFASRDALTGLLNREGLLLRMGRALEHHPGSKRSVGVLLMDLDRFRLVNDSLGQPAGDQLLRSVAARIRAVTRNGDAVARLGADRFVVQVDGISGVQALTAMARNLLRAFEPAYVLDGGDTVVATPSIGIVVAGEHAGNVDALLKCAEAAMRAAKAEGGGRFCSYDPAMQADDAMRLDIDRRLRCALQAEEFFLAFQPIFSADGERIVAVEALLRWADPMRGVMQPAEFIPVLEQTGLIVPVGRRVLREACDCGATWIAAGARSLVLSVNVSPRQFAEANFVETVTAVLAETGFPPAQLQLEVTEGLLLDPTPQSLHKIEMLTDAGVRLVIDDFGMGYSSLAYLKRFRLHALKVDRMFVRDVALHPRDTAIVRAIVDLGHSLGLHVTAEGVESAEQFDELRRIGCDSMQGFLFARPVGAAEMQAMLVARAVVDCDNDAAPDWSTTMTALLGSGERVLDVRPETSQ